MAIGNVEVINLSGEGIPVEEARIASKWMARAFAQAPAEPALSVMFGPSSYPENAEMHEAFWAAHINRVAKSGILLGARDAGGWKGFRCVFSPGQGPQPFLPDFKTGSDVDWTRFLELTGKDAYMGRLRQWGGLTKATQEEIGLDTSQLFTTSIIVVNPEYQRMGVGQALDDATQAIARTNRTKIFLRTHDHSLPFYTSQGYQVLASPTYTFGELSPFKVHFLINDCER